jgi:hypothetical protein
VGASGPMPPPCTGAVGLARRRSLPRRVNVVSAGATDSGEPAVSASVPTGSNCGIAVVAPAATLAAIVTADEPGAGDRAGVPGVDPIAGGCDKSGTLGSGAAALPAPKAMGWGAVAGVAGAAAAVVGSTVAADVAVGAGLGGGGVVVVARSRAVDLGTGAGAGSGTGGGVAGAGGVPLVLGAAVVVGTGFEV